MAKRIIDENPRDRQPLVAITDPGGRVWYSRRPPAGYSNRGPAASEFLRRAFLGVVIVWLVGCIAVLLDGMISGSSIEIILAIVAALFGAIVFRDVLFD